MSVHDETNIRPICEFCNQEIPYAQKERHIDGRCQVTKVKCLICGSRSINNKELVYQCIQESGFDIGEIVSGCAIGIDLNAIEVAEELKITVSKFPAKWNDLKGQPCKIKYNQYGKPYNSLAGFNRNQDMINYIKPDGVVIAIHNNSAGTKNTVKLARESGLKVFEKIVS